MKYATTNERPDGENTVLADCRDVSKKNIGVNFVGTIYLGGNAHITGPL